MKILILGGTRFLGRHLVEAALARGHELTLFNRGQSNPGLFPQVENVEGDRTTDLSALKGRSWDAVIDTCGYVPRIVEMSARLLAPNVGHYTFISSISAYSEFTQPGMDESHPLATMEDETIEEVNGETYGPLKVLCEQVVKDYYPDGTLNIRPGLIVGPHDPTDRFTYWPYRIARGGDILVPEDFTVQIIDARDLAEWNIRLVEAGETGDYNATGPDYPLRMMEINAICRQVSGSDAKFVYVDETFLEQEEVGPWMELPLWVPYKTSDEYAGFSSVNVDKAINDGLTFRSLEDTVRDTLEWVETWPAGYEIKAGLKPERERELLQKWAEQAEES